MRTCRSRSLLVRAGSRGFSLTELLVSLAIMSVAVVAVATLFDRSNRLARVESSVTDAQQNARYGSYQVVREVRMAGAGSIPPGLGSVQMAVTLSIGTSSYHSSIAGRHLVNNVNSTTDDVCIGASCGNSSAHHVRKGTDVLHVRGIISSPIYDLGTSSYNSATGQLLIHSCTKYPDVTTSSSGPCSGNGINDVSSFSSFSGSRLFFMQDQRNYGIALVTAATMGTDANGLSNVTLTLSTTNAYANSLNPLGSFNGSILNPVRGGLVDDYLYFVDDGTAAGATCGTSNQTTSPGPCHPQLAVAQWGAGSAGSCTITTEEPFACATVTPIADDIEDMQIAYGVDFYKLTCSNSGSSLTCSGAGSLASQQTDGSISITDASSFATIVKAAYTTSSPNKDPSEDTSASGKDEWVGNVTGEIDSTGTTFGYTSDLTNLKAIEISILAKGTNPDPKYTGVGAKAWSIMDSGAQLISSQNGYAYHRRLTSVRVDFRNFQSQ